ncbi:uncharacterized protein UTRI_05815_B [Ustilago trichophora]|uniref:Uncharacterized protein n=1 Tax=Ustilago trichophora TaxID=86804 RepID=A0A5C3ESB7_9BASI|nr:uncharacterized protein UTRI_05815_B [Ustilago trichophora]
MAAGPPPGLGIAAPPAAALPPNPFGANGSQGAHKSPLPHHAAPETTTVKYQRPSNCPRTYSRGLLLAFSSSALVAKPTNMAPLRDWFGEWEPYHHKATPYYRDTPRRGGHAAEEASHHAAEGEDAANNSGIIGGALGGFGPRREGAGARFGGRRNEDRERSEGLRLGEVGGRRVAPAGKNPFGQISASGTFKPAGTPGGGRGLPRDGNADGLGEGRRSGMGERSTSYGKDRMREMLPEDRRRDPTRDRRRGERGLDADESREEGEIIESPRIRRTGGADTASDWRRPGDRDRAGPFSSIASDRLRPGERRGTQRAGGAPWSGDADDNPAWLEDDSEPLPVDNRAPFGQFGSRRKEADGIDDLSRGDDMAGAVDSIQAFKAQMKERERRERLARGEPEPADNHAVSESTRFGTLGADKDAADEYQLGSDAASRQSEMEAIRQEMMAAANQRSSSGTSLYDSISNSHGGSEGQGPPGLPVRSSRFARFFDGRGAPPRDPQAAALAAQQRMLESMGNLGSANAASEAEKDAASVQSPQSPPNASSSSINISELFSKTSIRDKGDGAQKDKNVTEADQQSMQKLMAMLQGGGGSGGSGTGTPTLAKGSDGHGDGHSYQQPESADRLKELLRSQGRGGEDGSNERPRSIVSPGLSSAEAHGHGIEARSPLPYNQQHQRESSASLPQQMPPQHHQQQQQQQHLEQYPQYQQQQRSESPAMGGGAPSPYNDPRQQLSGVGSPTSPGGPGVGSPGPAPGLAGFGGFPGAMPGRPPPPGMDPRLMARPPMGGPGFQQMPPHIAASLGLARGPMPPGMGNMPPPPMGVPGGPRGPNGAFPAFGPFPGGRPPPPGMPPQLYQQLMSMPPHIQQQVLAGQGFPPGMPPPPRSPYDMPGTPGGGGPDRRSQSPAAAFPYYAAQGPAGANHGPSSPQQPQAPVSVGSQAMNGANLMALLSGGRNTPTNSG